MCSLWHLPTTRCLSPSTVTSISVVLKEFVVGQKDLPRFRNELSLLNRLSQCDGVVKILSAFLDGDRAYIEMPRYTFGSLLQWVRDTNPSAEVRLQSAHRIASALERIHALGVVHCDIKPDNVFVDDDGLPYIGDFDVSMPTADRTRLFSTQTIAHGGTPAYMAPELIRGQSATKASDIYSLGLVILDLFGDGTPRAVGAAPVVPRSLANALKTLLESMLLADPAARPSASSVVGSAAFRGVLVSAPLPIVAPLYWNQPRLVGTIPLLVDVTAEMRDVLQQIVDRTIVQGALGIGRDIPPGTPPYSKLAIAKVERVESPALYKRYLSLCDALRTKHHGATPTPAAPAAETDGWYDDNVLYAPMNVVGEKWLFHSTTWTAVPKIVRDGFDMRLSGGAFGSGSYFAENACKADQYARRNDSDEYPLLLCRVALGACVPTSVSRDTVRRPPCIHGHYDDAPCDHPRADSHYAKCKRKDTIGAVERHREFVIFDLHQAYPQFILTYKRTK
jgi:hypothetical protein